MLLVMCVLIRLIVMCLIEILLCLLVRFRVMMRLGCIMVIVLVSVCGVLLKVVGR